MKQKSKNKTDFLFSLSRLISKKKQRKSVCVCSRVLLFLSLSLLFSLVLLCNRALKFFFRLFRSTRPTYSNIYNFSHLVLRISQTKSMKIKKRQNSERTIIEPRRRRRFRFLFCSFDIDLFLVCFFFLFFFLL